MQAAEGTKPGRKVAELLRVTAALPALRGTLTGGQVHPGRWAERPPPARRGSDARAQGR